MSSWWIEGKVARGFQYLPETCLSQKSDACNFWERQTWPKLHVIASWFYNDICRYVGLFHHHIRKNTKKITLQSKYKYIKKHYGDRDSTKKLQSFISIVVP